MCAFINTKIGLPGPSTVPPKLGNFRPLPLFLSGHIPAPQEARCQERTDARSAYHVHVHRHVGLRGRLVVWHGARVHRGRGLDQTRLLIHGERGHEQIQAYMQSSRNIQILMQ